MYPDLLEEPHMSTTRIALMFIAACASHANAQGFGFGGGFEWPDLTVPIIGDGNLPLIPMANRISDGESHVYFDAQAAIDDALPGDRIELTAGTWQAGLMIVNKTDLELVAPAGPANTVIDGNGTTRGLFIDESSNITLTGIGFRHCEHDADQAFRRGGALMIWDSDHVTLNECWFRENRSHRGGGGVDARNSEWLTVQYCLFEDNIAQVGHHSPSGSGGGLDVSGSNHAMIEHSVFLNNRAGWGGGIDTAHSDITIFQCYFGGNTASFGSAIHTDNHQSSSSDVILTQSVVFNNKSTTRYEHDYTGAVWVGINVHLQSLATMYWKNRGRRAACIGVHESGDLSMFGCTLAGNRSQEGGDMMLVQPGGAAQITNSRIDCGRSFAPEVDGNYSSFGGNSALDHCVYTADMNFDATIDIHDILVLFEHWGEENSELTDLVPSNANEAPVFDVADLQLILESYGDFAVNPLLE
jgi:hypothetical protein